MGMSKGAWIVVGVGVAALATGSAFAGTQYANRVAVQQVVPAPNDAVATARPLVAFRTPQSKQLTRLKVTLNDRDVTKFVGRSRDGRLVLKTPNLKDGKHTVSVTAASRNIFSRTVNKTWSFRVDTRQPGLQVARPARDAVNSRSVTFGGRSEPGSTVNVRWVAKKDRGTVTAVVDRKGHWSTSTRLPEGPAKLRMVATDAAGNSRATTATLTVDTVAPALRSPKLPAKLTTDDPIITGTFKGVDPGEATIGARINGRTVLPARIGQIGGGIPTLSVEGQTFEMSVGAIPQGRNTVEVFVRDRAGNAATVTSKVVVDSTEEFGAKDLMPGARGEDVRALQAALKDRGLKRTRVTGVYDKQTVANVKRYQKRITSKQTGFFTRATREQLVGKVVIDISKYRLVLLRDGKVAMKFKVAVGQPRYPTPTGSYVIVNKQSDPTWTPPPDSDWAKGLGPIPPGPGNPLGTRWIGTSAPLVGIHGTYEPASIGTAASHGCIRMNIPDVERLYDEVAVGMPVIMRP